MNYASPRILSVGQCHFDGPWMKRVLEEHLGAVVEQADFASEAVNKAGGQHYDLILVNREFDRDQSSGLSLIPDLIAASPQTPVMLVSDFEEAQEAAIGQGAIRGFGKSNLDTAETLQRLKQAVHSAPTTGRHHPK
ncbi:MAG TPA: response regulator [Pirellulales bacterium]|jgi:DNA-binding NarL/FixJ family response regulator|nr:response regulator [Pirellulales bacterium]